MREEWNKGARKRPQVVHRAAASHRHVKLWIPIRRYGGSILFVVAAAAAAAVITTAVTNFSDTSLTTSMIGACPKQLQCRNQCRGGQETSDLEVVE